MSVFEAPVFDPEKFDLKEPLPGRPEEISGAALLGGGDRGEQAIMLLKQMLDHAFALKKLLGIADEAGLRPETRPQANPRSTVAAERRVITGGIA